MWLYKNPQAFSSQSWQISFSNVFFVLNPFLLFAKMDLLRVSSQQAKKDGCRFTRPSYLVGEIRFWL